MSNNIQYLYFNNLFLQFFLLYLLDILIIYTEKGKNEKPQQDKRCTAPTEIKSGEIDITAIT